MTNLLTPQQRQERAERRVNRFVSRFKPSYLDLVRYAALPLILTPELVSYLRNEFLREIDWIAEVDLLLSELCSPVGYELYMMDADVRAYVLSQHSATFTDDRKREVANLLISYVRYLAEHRAYLSDRELESQQWAAMMYLGETERQTVVSELVERFQSAATGGTVVGADLLDRAEMARLAQLTQTLSANLADYQELVEYAALVSDVQLRNMALERTRVEKTYVVAPGQYLRLPASLQTELLAQGRVQNEPVVVPVEQSVTDPAQTTLDPEQLPDGASPLTPPPHHPTTQFPPLQPIAFDYAQLVETDTSPDPEPASDLERFDFTIATLEQQTSPQQQDQPPSLWDRILGRGTNRDAVASGPNPARTEWVIRQRPGQARRWIERLDGSGRSEAGVKGRKRPQAQQPKVNLEMAYIPGGTFEMGSPEHEPERRSSESPQHSVTVPSFLMGCYPITQAQWRLVAALERVERDLKPDPSRFKGDNRPVEKVSWYDAVEFCARLSRLTQRDYRLPTEAEWEYACRAGTTTPFHFGETITTELANYRGTDDSSLGWKGNYGSGPKGEYREETTPVDHFDVANAFGLCDMHGNVYEWCQDHWHDNYEGAPIDGSAWLTENESANRVMRGGSWSFFPRYCRSAGRDDDGPGFDASDVGFRVCCPAPRTS